MITQIRKLKDCGIFREFDWPSTLHDFGRFNLIYGWNGSGKSTIGRLLRCLELKQSPGDGEVLLQTDNGQIRDADFPTASLLVRVFNRDFVEQSVFPTGRDTTPIYVLGQSSVTLQKELDVKRKELETQRDVCESNKLKVQSLQSEIRKLCTEKAKYIKELLRSSDVTVYNTYDRKAIRSRLDSLATAANVKSGLMTNEQFEESLNVLKEAPRDRIPQTSVDTSFLLSIDEEARKLLKQSLVAESIESLKSDPELSGWLQDGLTLVKARSSSSCLFCGQEIPPQRLKELELHFNEKYELLMSELGRLRARIKDVRHSLNLSLPKSKDLYEELRTVYVSKESMFTDTREKYFDYLTALDGLLAKKEKNAFQELEFLEPLPTGLENSHQDVTTVIDKHNLICSRFRDRLNKTRLAIESHKVAECFDEFQSKTRTLDEVDSQVQAALASVEKLNQRIIEIERQLITHRRPADEINSEIVRYLGHSDLTFAVKDTGYEIRRNGRLATTLSEGEATAISILYFLKSLEDHSFDRSKGIVVLDDPVSSLDANALFSAFGFIRDRTEDVSQLFIFTHNFSFFRQVRSWIGEMKDQKKPDVTRRPGRFFMIACKSDDSGRFSEIQELDNILQNFESEYHYLFSIIYRNANSPDDLTPELSYVLPNVARRLLESFLAFRIPNINGRLTHKVSSLTFDEDRKHRIVRFLHTHSHNDALSEPEHDLSRLSEAKAALSDTLSLIEEVDKAHFDAMVSLLK